MVRMFAGRPRLRLQEMDNRGRTMKKLTTLLAVYGLIYVSLSYAHLCNNVYRSPDRFIVKPEKSVTAVDKSEEVRVFVKNNFPVPMNKVALTAKSDDEGVKVSVVPEQVAVMKPGDKVDFKLKIQVAPSARAEKHKISIGISADKLGFESLDEPPIDRLREIVQTRGTNPSTQVLAAEALAKRDDPIGFEFLEDMAKNHRSSDYRGRAIRGLGRAAKLEDKATIAFLQELLEENDGYIKGNAMIALAMVSGPPGKGVLTEKDPLVKACSAAARTSKDPFVKTCAQAALTYRGSKNYLMSLRRSLKDDDPYVKVAAAWGLASSGKKEGIAVLDELLGTPSNDVRLRIFIGEALISLPEQDSKPKAN